VQPLKLSKEQVDSVIALYSSGKINETIIAIKALNESYPNVPLLFNILGACYKKLKLIDAAAKMFLTAITLKPDYAEAHFNYGVTLRDSGQTDLAVESYRKAIAFLPNYPDAHNNLGSSLLELDQYEDAVEHFEWAIAYKPKFFEAYNNLGLAKQEIDQIHEAITYFEKAIAINPVYAQAHLNLGNAFESLGQKDAALNCFELALANDPSNAQAQLNIGTAFKELGNIEVAIQSFKKAIEINPSLGVAYFNLTNMMDKKVDGKLITKMLSILSSNDLKQSDRINFCFALANSYKYLDKNNDFIKFLHEGNRLRKLELNSSLERSQSSMGIAMKIFKSVPSINKKSIQFEPSNIRPIFIVGMPRSGSTLVEQILSSHSSVHGAGEIQSMRKIISPVLKSYANDNSIFISQFNDKSLNKDRNSFLPLKVFKSIRQKYLNALSKISVSENIIVDKELLNFRFIGFILTAFPEAKIIHQVRDARATCWSIYQSNFHQSGLGFGNNIEDLSGYYKSYIKMMNFWHKTFPNKIYDLNYENMTTNQKIETKKLLEYCELDWDKNCLNFHSNKRAVKTASSLQVRKKMYQGSSEAWKKYETHLKPLVEALKSY